MATTVLYRVSSGEVYKISTKGQMFPSIDSNYFGYLTDVMLVGVCWFTFKSSKMRKHID